MKEYYLDANAHVPQSPLALSEYQKFSSSRAAHGHPSSPHAPGRQAAETLETARGKIATLIGAKQPGQIIFTNSCTSACEWGLSILQAVGGSSPIVSSPVEHPAVRDVLKEQLRNTEYLRIDSNGIVQTIAANKVCCLHMQNEIGTIQPIQNFAANYLFSDMSQSLGKIPINVTELDVDIAAFGAHKFGGPGNFGFLYLKTLENWKSFGNGSRYFLDRVGTPDVGGAVATAVALEEALATLEKRRSNMLAFQNTLETGLEKLGFEIIGKPALRSPNTTFVGGFAGKSLTVMMELSQLGIYMGLGSACGSLHNVGNPTMQAIRGDSVAWNYLRISQWGEYNDDDARYILNKLEGVWKQYA